MMKKFARPAELYTSNYFAKVDSELCEGCETCLDRCQMEALTIEDDISTVNLDSASVAAFVCQVARRVPCNSKKKK